MSVPNYTPNQQEYFDATAKALAAASDAITLALAQLDPTQPPQGRAQTAPLRDNFAALYQAFDSLATHLTEAATAQQTLADQSPLIATLANYLGYNDTLTGNTYAAPSISVGKLGTGIYSIAAQIRRPYTSMAPLFLWLEPPPKYRLAYNGAQRSFTVYTFDENDQPLDYHGLCSVAWFSRNTDTTKPT